MLMTRLGKLANRSPRISGTTERNIRGNSSVWHLEPWLADPDTLRNRDCVVMSAEVDNMLSNDRSRNGVSDE
jgi:hypothetical protein